jgi:argininosuccinate lyase
MAKIKNNNAIWNKRIKVKPSTLLKKFGNSINIDKRLYRKDIDASIVHVEMLYSQKIISLKIKNKIVWGLKKIHTEIKNNKFFFNEELEDIHMNIENRLSVLIGEDAGYIHTARSRNDQVITDLKLWMIDATNEILNCHNQIIKSFLNLAEKNIKTIMPGFTHLKNAQPISFAHYLLAYVEMFIRDKKRLKNNL